MVNTVGEDDIKSKTFNLGLSEIDILIISIRALFGNVVFLLLNGLGGAGISQTSSRSVVYAIVLAMIK
ncbi:hypothetical protein FLACOL7796_04542 [Flavobacterium collinsii]|uniref:Uncharacterized protein n=1 Tax=Flavobacterium collinsii TaxID=1114861 RepID=A0ABM8KQ44_9FLAO|nr:hypothetical protein FLACOL7796_04542 [Flavobacterium collinsii]